MPRHLTLAAVLALLSVWFAIPARAGLLVVSWRPAEFAVTYKVYTAESVGGPKTLRYEGEGIETVTGRRMVTLKGLPEDGPLLVSVEAFNALGVSNGPCEPVWSPLPKPSPEPKIPQTVTWECSYMWKSGAGVASKWIFQCTEIAPSPPPPPPPPSSPP